MQRTFVQPRNRYTAIFLLVLSLVLTVTTAPLAFAKDDGSSEETVAERAKVAWENGSINGGLDLLDQWSQDHPHTLALDKLRGDILATSRRLPEAVQAYETVLVENPTALDVRWAKWAVLIRSGQSEEAIAELQRIAQLDAQNPLIYLRLAQELRKLDRLEESLEPYKKAVELVPGLLSWRLGMARARFDILDYPGAYTEVESMLQTVPPGSPLEVPAQNLLPVIRGEDSATDRGRRFIPFAPPEVPAEQLKEWALARGEAWRLFSERRFQEAVPVYRRLLALYPSDPTAAHQLGLSLMQLGRCEEALSVFGTMSKLDPSDEEYADTLFRMGQCQVKLERWEEAFVNFQILYEAAVESEKSTKDRQLPAGTRVLDKKKLARWIEKVRPHVPEADRLSSGESPSSPVPSQVEPYAKIAAAPLKPHKPLDTRASLMGRDADFSWFRFVIPASKVMRDDSPTGEHEFIPVYPGDSFSTTQQEIYLVFALVTASYDALPFTAQCVLEASEIAGEQRGLAQDKVLMSMSDQSGYFKLSPPKTGWTPGLYRCGLFEGALTSAYSQVDEVRFRIVNVPPMRGSASR